MGHTRSGTIVLAWYKKLNAFWSKRAAIGSATAILLPSVPVSFVALPRWFPHYTMSVLYVGEHLACLPERKRRERRYLAGHCLEVDAGLHELLVLCTSTAALVFLCILQCWQVKCPSCFSFKNIEIQRFAQWQSNAMIAFTYWIIHLQCTFTCKIPVANNGTHYAHTSCFRFSEW